MSTLAEIEAAIPQLTASELAELEQFLRKTKQEKAAERSGHQAIESRQDAPPARHA